MTNPYGLTDEDYKEISEEVAALKEYVIEYGKTIGLDAESKEITDCIDYFLCLDKHRQA